MTRPVQTAGGGDPGRAASNYSHFGSSVSHVTFPAGESAADSGTHPAGKLAARMRSGKSALCNLRWRMNANKGDTRDKRDDERGGGKDI